MSDSSKKLQYDVIIIGGGITGAGCARDCAMRGLRVLLLERADLTNGATGRNHGLLHSGARYAVTDSEAAAECIRENRTLRKVAAHCVEETEGLFITLPEDDLAYQAKFIESCRKAGINAEAIDPKEALRMEPAVNPALIGAVKVPDGAVDPFRLTIYNAYDARLHGAEIRTYHEVTAFLKDDSGRVVGVKAHNHADGTDLEFHAGITVIAGGIWGTVLAKKAGVNVGMFPAKGALLIFGHRVNNMVINRCRKPADADILVPGDTICLIGTTSTRIPIEACDDIRVTPEEVDLLWNEGIKLAPALADTHILRAYGGVRPLVAADNDPTGRSISRGIVCLDHETRDGIPGLITITGGKLMTYRLMAEMATDMVCKKLGNTRPCETATTPLTGSDGSTPQADEHTRSSVKAARGRHGSHIQDIPTGTTYETSLVCECEEVSVGEVKFGIEQLKAKNLVNLRRRTRLGMGTCQGEVCACRAAGLIAKANNCAEGAKKDLASFLQERWKGMFPVTWGTTVREAQYTSMIYQGLCGIDQWAADASTTREKPVLSKK
ncbi:MAG: anaerobic glycerol-3-phosphate dehydrogenase subunit A [Bacteroidales bacterium]|nr:anaerobic glycerol-3-phosphate dehydrogenase subunit A [Bacteroidales bacterium]